jgi:hypothetical protein
MKKNIIVGVAILLSCCSAIGAEKDKKLPSLVALKKIEDSKKSQDIATELHKCEMCHKYNAKHRHPGMGYGFLCAPCANDRAWATLVFNGAVNY